MLTSVPRTLPVTVVAALLLVACGGAAAPTATPTKAPAAATSTSAPSAAAPTATPLAAAPTATRAASPTAPALPAKPAGKVTIVISDAGAQPLDPHKLVGGSEAAVSNFTFEGLLGLDLNASLESRLATAWEAKENATIWEFKLRPGVKFHNGDSMTAEDVKFSYEKALKDTGTQTVLRQFMDNIEVVDAQTVRIRLKKPLSPFEYSGASIAIEPKSYIEKIGAAQFAKERPVGTGPFKFLERRLDEFASYEAFEGHWRRAPFVQTATVRLAAEPSVRLAMLKTGEADVMGGALPLQAQEINNIAGLRTISAKGTGLMWMWFFGATKVVDGKNVSRSESESPWVNKVVRQAANYAIDRDAIVKGLFRGDAEPMVTVVMPGAFGFDPKLKPYPYDPKKARELLAQAGYPNGFTTDLYSTPHGAINFTEETTVAVAKFFADVGIKANLKKIDYGTYLVQVRERKLDGLGVIASSFNPEGWNPMNSWVSTRNWASSMWDDRVDVALDKIAQESDRAKREAALQGLVAADLEMASAIYLVYGNTTYGLNSRIRDWQVRRGAPYLDRVDLLRLAD